MCTSCFSFIFSKFRTTLRLVGIAHLTYSGMIRPSQANARKSPATRPAHASWETSICRRRSSIHTSTPLLTAARRCPLGEARVTQAAGGSVLPPLARSRGAGSATRGGRGLPWGSQRRVRTDPVVRLHYGGRGAGSRIP